MFYDHNHDDVREYHADRLLVIICHNHRYEDHMDGPLGEISM